MKQENMYIYQWLYRLCYVPIIAPFGVSTYPFKRLREARLCAALSQYVSGILAGLDVPVAYFYAEEDALTIAFHESRKQSV